jgi:hypothetical protein
MIPVLWSLSMVPVIAGEVRSREYSRTSEVLTHLMSLPSVSHDYCVCLLCWKLIELHVYKKFYGCDTAHQ